MAFTNVLPGSTNYPELLLEWAPQTGPTAATQKWEDITDLLRGWSWGYGRNDELARFEAGTGHVLLDNRDRLFDPSFSGEDTTNVLVNGGFETNTTGWLVFGAATIARVTQATFGVAGLEVVCTGTDTGARVELAGLTVGATYVFSADVRVAAGESVRATFQSPTGTFVGVSSTVTGDGTWQRLTGTFVVGAGGTARMIPLSRSGAQTFHLDGVQVEAGTVPHRYVETNGAAASRSRLNIKPRRMFRLRARWSGTTYPVFEGYARGFPQSYPAAGFDSIVKVDLVDAFAILQAVDLVIGFSRDAEGVTARLGAVLDAIGVPAGLRDLDAGSVTVAEIDVTSSGTSGLDHAKAVALDSEMGQLFVAKDGRVTFHEYARRLNAASVHTFSDDGAALQYGLAFEPAFDETYWWNYVRATGAAGDPSAEVAENAGSVAADFPITKPVATQLTIGSEIRQVAERYVLRYAQLELRAPSLPLNGARGAAALWPVLLDLEVSDRITVERFGADAEPMVLVQNVEGIRHDCQPGGPWTTSVPTSPADEGAYLELNDATFGELDDIYMLA